MKGNDADCRTNHPTSNAERARNPSPIQGQGTVLGPAPRPPRDRLDLSQAGPRCDDGSPPGSEVRIRGSSSLLFCETIAHPLSGSQDAGRTLPLKAFVNAAGVSSSPPGPPSLVQSDKDRALWWS